MDSTRKLLGPVTSRVLLAFIVFATAGVFTFSYLTNSNTFNKYSRAAEPTIVTYYVDCSAGADTNSGTSETSAWRTFSRPNSTTLNPGDQLLLKKDCTWQETLNVRWTGTAAANIVVGAYGTGTNDPIVEAVHPARSSSFNITGDYITLQNVYAKVTPTNFQSCGSGNNPVGYAVGFELQEASSYITVQNSKATGGYAGIAIKRSSGGAFSHHNRILNNVIENNLMMSPLTVGGDDDAGGFGVLIRGDDNEIAYNTISGHDACSHDYTRDGGAAEIFGGLRNNVHHNRSINNDAFTELGDSRGADNTFAYNLITSSLNQSIGILTRGVGNFGPVLRTKAYNNTIYLTGAASQGLVCANNCGDTTGSILTAKNNIFWADWKAAYASSQFNEGNNIYWRTGGSPVVQGITVPTERRVNPQFVNVAASNFNLLSNSYGVNNGSMDSVLAGYTSDYDSHCVPVGTGVDIGGYEYNSTAPCGTSPTPQPTLFPTITPTPTLFQNPPTPTPALRPQSEWLKASDIVNTNNDNVVNTQDFSRLRSQMGQVCTSAFQCSDINCDGVVSTIDFTILRNNFGMDVTGLPPVPACAYFAATPTPTPGVVTLQAVADSYVNGELPDDNYGSLTTLISDLRSPLGVIYLKFDLSSYAGRTITSARLKVRTTTAVNAGSTVMQSIREVPNSNWSEGVINYNNRPPVATGALATLSGTVSDTEYTINLPPTFVQLYAGSMFTVAIDQTVDDGFLINSREVTTAGIRPRLEVSAN